MTDRTDQLIEAIVSAREAGLTRRECWQLVYDTFSAPWSDDPTVSAVVVRPTAAPVRRRYDHLRPSDNYCPSYWPPDNWREAPRFVRQEDQMLADEASARTRREHRNAHFRPGFKIKREAVR